ncbi:hypothetical protein LguiB_002127 [Lonicera macranthoides]
MLKCGILSHRHNTMENVLLEASMSGKINILETLIQNDQLILDRVLATSFNENPLHIASLRGHLDFVKKLLIHKRELAASLDASRHSPLHLASGGGHIEIVRVLIKINPEVCHFHDQDGKIPLHFASFHEHVDIMNELIQVKPELVREIFDNGETLLHFCVKHNRVEALKVLVKSLGDNGNRDFINTKDDRGNTILHLAVINKQFQTISYLLSEGGIDGNALTENGKTALDLLELYPRDFDSRKIRKILTGANIKRAIDLNTTGELSIQSCSSKVKHFILMIWKSFLKSEPMWFEQARGNLMVAATVIAAMAFQAAVNPPGGVWQDSAKDDPATISIESHTAGYSIAATDLPFHYNRFLIFNTTSFVASLSTVLLIIGGFPLKHKVTTWLLMMTICLAIASMILTYLQSIIIITADNETLATAYKMVGVVSLVIIALYALVLFLHIVRFSVWIGKKLRKFFHTMRIGEKFVILP